jgi:hypothetical protein
VVTVKAQSCDVDHTGILGLQTVVRERDQKPEIVPPMEFPMLTAPTLPSTSGSLGPIRFVIVNDRVPRVNAECALCGSKIEKCYVRESQTRLLYCDTQCYSRAISGRGSKFSGDSVPARRGHRAYDYAGEYEFSRARHYVPSQFIVTDG